MKDLIKDKFINKKLSVKLGAMADIGFKINSSRGLIRAAILLLCRNKEYDWVKVREIKIICPAENNVFI